MADPNELKPDPKKPFSKFKIFLYVLALAGLVWAGLEGYWAFFKLKIWLKGFGNGTFWTLGLVAGFIYFYSAHKIQERIKSQTDEWKKRGATVGFALGLLILNPIPLSLILWLFPLPGSINMWSRWFFIGCLIGSAIVLLLERLFAKKKPASTSPQA